MSYNKVIIRNKKNGHQIESAREYFVSNNGEGVNTWTSDIKLATQFDVDENCLSHNLFCILNVTDHSYAYSAHSVRLLEFDDFKDGNGEEKPFIYN